MDLDPPFHAALPPHVVRHTAPPTKTYVADDEFHCLNPVCHFPFLLPPARDGVDDARGSHQPGQGYAYFRQDG